MVQTILMIVLVLLMVLSVACGVYAVAMLKRALDKERNKGSSDEPSGGPTRPTQRPDPAPAPVRIMLARTMVADLARQQLDANRELSDANRALRDAQFRAGKQTAEAIDAWERWAARRQGNTYEEAHRRLFDELSQYGEVRTVAPHNAKLEGPGSTLTQRDIDRWLDRGGRHPQTA